MTPIFGRRGIQRVPGNLTELRERLEFREDEGAFYKTENWKGVSTQNELYISKKKKKSLASSLWHSTDIHIYDKKLPLIEEGEKTTVSSKPHYSWSSQKKSLCSQQPE